jgi:hypothetical protein
VEEKMTIQPGANLYTIAFGNRPENVEVPHVETRAPTSADVGYPIGKRWIYLNNGEYTLLNLATVNGITTATWTLLGTDTGPLNTLTGNTGGALSPSSNNINIVGAGPISVAGTGSTLTISFTPGTTAIETLTGGSGGPISPVAGNVNVLGTANQITTIGSGNTITWSIPTTFIAPGSIASVSTITAATGLTVTSGGATITSGGLTVSAGGAAITGNSTVTGTFTASAGLTVTSGGATITAGGLTVSAGGAAITGNSTVTGTFTTSAGLIVSAGGATITSGGLTVSAGGAGITGNSTVTGTLTVSTTITATLGNITATNGNFVLGTAGNKLNSTSVATTTAAGANSFGTVALVAGTATVATTAVTASSMIFLTCQALGTVVVPSALCVSSKTAGTNFIITASQGTDTSTIAWFIVN